MLKLIIVIGMLLSATYVHAERVRVATETWASYSEKDGTGLYLEMVEAAFAKHDIEVEVILVPYARAVELVISGQADIVLAVYLDDYGDKLIYSDSIVSIDRLDAIISPALDEQWQGAESLAGKTVVAQTDFRFNQHFDFQMNYFEVPAVENRLKMLAAGRVDAVLDYESTVLPIWDAAGLTPRHKIKRGLLQSNLHFAFSNNIRGLHLKRAFDTGFQEALTSDEIKGLHLQYLGNLSVYPGHQVESVSK